MKSFCVKLSIMVSLLISARGASAQVPGPVYPNSDSSQVLYGGVDYQAIVPTHDPTQIHLKDLKTDKVVTIVDADSNVADARPSPDFGKVAYREHNAASGAWTLRVMSMAGKEITAIEGVYRFSWGPDSTQICYIVGTPSEGGFGFKSQGVCIYSLESDQVKITAATGGYDINWALFDENIYLLDLDNDGEVVMCYNPKMGNLTTTNYKGIYFSPNGTMYYRPAYHGTGFEVFERDSERSIEFESNTRGGDDVDYQYAQPSGWLDDGTLIFPSDKPGDVSEYEFDVSPGGSRSGEPRIKQRQRGDFGTMQLDDKDQLQLKPAN